MAFTIRRVHARAVPIPLPRPALREVGTCRHKMQVPELQRCYGEREITGAPEIRRVTETSVQPFNPFEHPEAAGAIIAPMPLWTR